MAQLLKAARKSARDISPCVKCGESHVTWQHGKDEGEAWRQLRSRQMNRLDPLFDPKVKQLVPRISPFDASRNKRLIDDNRTE